MDGDNWAASFSLFYSQINFGHILILLFLVLMLNLSTKDRLLW